LRAALLLAPLVALGSQESSPPVWPAFPAFVWRQDSAGRGLEQGLAREFGGTNVEGAAEDARLLEQELAFYVGHGPGRDALHLDTDRESYRELWDAYWRDRDGDRLVRVPCLHEEEVRADMGRRLERTLAARGGAQGLGVSLGDEVGLTPYGAPLDLCASSACRAAFADFVQASPTWSALLEVEDGRPPFPTTDETRLAWIDGDPRHVSAWLARRDFHVDTVEGLLEELARQLRRARPELPVGLLGQSGRTAFGDVDLADVLPFLDFIEVYRLLDSRELVNTWRRDDQRSLLTLFRDPEAEHGATWIAWEHWLRGGDGVVLWSDRELVRHPEHRRRMAEAVAGIRRLREAWSGWRPRPEGVGVIHSSDSLALSWLREALHDGPTWMRRFPSYQNRHGAREVALQGWLRLLEDLGVLPGAVPIERVGPELVGRFPVLIANHLVLLDPPEVARLRSYVAAGGQLWVHGPLGAYDRTGGRREAPLTETIDDGAGRVTTVTLDPGRYLRERWERRGELSYPSRARAALLELGLPVRPGAPEVALLGTDLPFLWAADRQADGGWLLASMPNAAASAERAALEELELAPVAPEGWELALLHPQVDGDSSTIRLAPGEALVVRLVRD